MNTGGTNVADYCLKNHVAAMGWSLRELTQAERSGIHTFLDYCNLARTQYKSFDSVCRMVEDVKEGDLLWMRSRNEGKYYIARVKANSIWVFREDAVQIDAANQLTNIDWYLKEYHPVLYANYLTNGTLHRHLAEIDQACNERMEIIVSAMAKQEGVTEALKAADQMEWVRRMNSIRSRAEEIVLTELIYE